MNELDRQLKRLADLNPFPSRQADGEPAADKLAARARLLAASRQAEAARPRRVRLARVAALATAGAVMLVVVSLVRGSDEDSRGDSFGSFAAIAAEQPFDGLRLVRWETQLTYDRPDYFAQGARYPDPIEDSTEVSVWTSDEVRFEEDVHRYWDGRDKVVRSTYLFDLPSRLLCWGGFDQMSQTNCAISSFAGDIGDPQEILDLPLEPDALREELQRAVEKYRDDEPQVPDPDCRLEGDEFGTPIPYSLITGEGRQTLITDLRAAAGLKENRSGWTYNAPNTELLFMTVTAFLSNPESSPEFRSALFEVLATIKGARLAPDGEDRLGREAAVIEYEAPPDERVALDQVFVDPETSEVLEQRTTVEEPRGSDTPDVLGTYYRVFTERSEVENLPASATPFVQALDRAKATCSKDR